jgi:cellulose synthase/poly-beta-1,6-N-acetylglucosamine synthase-like glycosyltransferase
MISIIVTAYEDPKSTKECLKRIFEQEGLEEKFELIAACPDEPTKKVIMDYKKKYPNTIKYIRQREEWGKNELMNHLLKIAKGRILIWTDGNKFFEKDAIRLLLEPFNDESVGIVGGRIIPINNENTFFGLWAHLLTSGLHKMRQKRFNKNKLIEHTANILAMRGGIIKKIPLNIAEGTIISFLITNKGYKNVYQPSAKVHVNYPEKYEKWFYQRARSGRAHMELLGYTKNSNIKYNNFYNQVILEIAKNTVKDFFRSIPFIFLLIYIQIRLYYSLRLRKKHYVSKW